MEDTKLLVSGAGASQEKLAQAAQSSVNTITKLADVVKLGAASLGAEDPETQVLTPASCPVHFQTGNRNLFTPNTADLTLRLQCVCVQCLATILGFLLFLWQHLIIHGIFAKLVITVLFKEIQPLLITLQSPFKFMNII